MKDNYFHANSELMYISESIPGPSDGSPEYEVLLGNYNSQQVQHCQCNNMCIEMLCTCLKLSHGDNYNRFYVDGEIQYKLNIKMSLLKDYPIIECSSICLCPPTCGNRIVQNGPMEGLIVKPCDDVNKGLGLFTPHPIAKQSFICEYAGEILTKTQALLRMQQNEVQGKMNYVFCLIENVIEGTIETFVDPSKFGNIGRYINHSCEPNCMIIPVRCEIAIPRLAIFAIRDIFPCEEITFNYGSTSVDDATVNTIGNRKNCLCHARTCRGVMPFEIV